MTRMILLLVQTKFMRKKAKFSKLGLSKHTNDDDDDDDNDDDNDYNYYNYNNNNKSSDKKIRLGQWMHAMPFRSLACSEHPKGVVQPQLADRQHNTVPHTFWH